jgi:photosystem II stability/assembly factor-like uncharacterized protein
MNRTRFLYLGLLSSLLFSGCAVSQTSPGEIFVAMIMTKDQRSSSVPTDSGILVQSFGDGQWQRLGPAIQMISSATADPQNPDTIFLACGNGIVRSKDGGKTWRMVTGWRESDVLQIVIDPEDGKRVYAATAWGVIISKDGGDTWSPSNTGLPENFCKGIVLDEDDTSRLLLANTKGLFESNDRGESWRRVTGFPELAVLRLRRSQSDPDLWIAGTEGLGVFCSRDDGKSWQSVAPELNKANIYAVGIDPFDSTHLAAGGGGTGVHVSSDSGRTWHQAKGTLPSPNVTAIVFDERQAGRLWASTFEEGTYFSDDMGTTWQSADLDGAYVFDLGFLPARS